MTNTSRPAALLAFVLSALLLVGVIAPASAFGARESAVLKALDFMHAQQRSTGGFVDAGQSDSPNTTPWAILAIVAAREDPLAWNKAGKDPIDYLQSLNLEQVAKASMNPPSYYAKSIMAVMAAGKISMVFSAGTPRIDLLAKLLSYRYDVEDNPATPADEDVDGHFSPATSGDRDLYDVSTTTWALLALVAARQSLDGDVVTETRRWLAAAQNVDGGWGIQNGAGSSVDQTAAAVQALVAGGLSISNATVQQAIGFLRAAQRPDGGFGEYLASTKSNAESTAWTVQAIEAVRQEPTGDGWVRNGHDPLEYLRSLRKPDGSFAHAKGSTGRSTMMTTTQCVLALSGTPFPLSPADRTLTSGYLPSITSFKPGNGAVFASTNDVSVVAEYKDNETGTGIDKVAVRVTVDGTNKTSKAKVTASGLSLVLVDLRYGQHTIQIRVADKAGNQRTQTHTITVSYTPGGGSSGGGSSGGSGGIYYPPSTPGGGRTPTPTTTLYPTPGATPLPTATPSSDGTVSGTPLAPGPSGSPLPSPSASAAAAATEGEGGSGAALGGMLLALLPIGAALSYWLHRRQAAALSNAGRGKILTGGGTPWQRLKGHLPGAS
jgi:prenyltransferase beta subunit